MKRAKLRGLERNAAVVPGNVGTADDADVLTRAVDYPEPLVRAHAWALGRLAPRAAVPALRDRLWRAERVLAARGRPRIPDKNQGKSDTRRSTKRRYSPLDRPCP
jgi:hypothetical protein